MIAKVFRSADFNKKVSYVLNKQDGRFLFSQNMGISQAPDRIAGMMQLCADQVADERMKKPCYHLIVSWDPGDEVTSEQMVTVAKKLIHDLGLEEHQAVAGEHADKDHAHMHIVLNRVHPDYGKLREDGGKNGVWKGKDDWPIIQQTLRELEVEYGWRQVEGSLSIQPGHELPNRGGEIRVEFEERKAQGLPPRQRGRDRARSEVIAVGKKKKMPDDLPRTRKQLYGMWYAAKRGDVDAQWKMGRMYMLGAGVEYDLEIAAGWFIRAAERGHRQAKKEFDRLEARGIKWVFPPTSPMSPSRKEVSRIYGRPGRGFSRDVITDRISDRIDNTR